MEISTVRTYSAILTTAVALASPLAIAGPIAYANNAGSAGIYKIDLDTGTVLQTYANPSGGNGRGVVVVGNVIYSTVVGDPNIYKTDATTGANLGTILTSVQSMSTIGWDGTAFWTTDYAGSNKGFRIDTSGNTIKTLSFSEATGYMDGMEFFNNKLIVNHTDGGFNGPIRYSIYDLDGNLLQKDFIVAPNGTGIAYDGKNFLVSDVRNTSGNSINVYDGTSGTLLDSIQVTGRSWLVEDLSVDYSQRPDTGGGNHNVPDGGNMMWMLAVSSAVCGAWKLRGANRN